MKEIDYSNCFKMWAEHSYEVYDLTRYTQGGSVKFERNIEYKETESSERVKLHEISHYSYEPHFSCWGFSVSLWFRPLILGLWKERDVSTQAEASFPDWAPLQFHWMYFTWMKAIIWIQQFTLWLQKKNHVDFVVVLAWWLHNLCFADTFVISIELLYTFMLVHIPLDVQCAFLSFWQDVNSYFLMTLGPNLRANWEAFLYCEASGYWRGILQFLKM